MLGRNAAGIYWMFRYLERCENSARLLRAGLRISITQSDYGSQDWDSVLTAASMRDKENPSSVLSSVKQARLNARMIRTVLTKEVFESVNEIYFNLKDLFQKHSTLFNVKAHLLEVVCTVLC